MKKQMHLNEAEKKFFKINGGIIKALLTILLLWFLFTKLDVKEVGAILSELSQSQLLLAILITVAAVILSAYKWQILLVSRGWKLSLVTLTKVYFVGLFMNNFLPSSIGGDMMRIYQIGKRINNNSEAAASVILERILATVGIALPAFFALLPNSQLLGHFAFYLFYFFLFCFILIFFVVRPSIFRPLKKISWNWWQKLLGKLKEIIQIIQSYRDKKYDLFRVIVYSVAFQLSIVMINYCLLRAMGIYQISLWQCTLMIPIISAVSMIPVSINGLGIREGAYLLLFGPLGLSASQAITLSMLFFTIVTATSLIGGLFFLLEKQKEDYVVKRKDA